MKKILSVLVLFVIVTSCNNTVEKSDGYVINGTAKGIHNGIRVYLKSMGERRKLTDRDTALVFNETFKFEGKIESPEIWYLFVDNIKANKPFMVENNDINIVIEKDNMDASVVTGSKSNAAFSMYSENVNKLSNERRRLNLEFRQASQKNDPNASKRITSELAAMTTSMASYPFEFITEHNDNYFSLTLIESLIESKTIDLNKLIETYNLLDSDIKGSNYGRKVHAKIMEMKKINEGLANLGIGKIAPDFSAPSTDGTPLALGDIKGKVTIIDFWASWCKPCRRENPNVVKTYEKYHTKGLEIISVSLDKPGQKDRWLKAIKDDKLTWHHVSNLNYFNDPVAKQYNIQSIPATYILDADGKIVAKNLRGPALEQKIGELLD